jgi:membrane protease YdiL (CAAX protease family)
MTAVSVAWASWRGLLPSWWRYDQWSDAALAAVAGLGMGVLGVLYTWRLERRIPDVQLLAERFGTIMAGLPPGTTWALAALSAIGEEAFFRGCLQEEVGPIVATVLFAAVHTGRDRVFRWWTIAAFMFGVFLAALYRWGGGLLPAVLMHFVINGVNLRVLSQRGVRARGRGLSLDLPTR